MNTQGNKKLTTLSVHIDLIAKLHEISEKRGLETDHIISYCLERYAKEIEVKLNLDSLSQYQPRCNEYKAFSVKFSQALYEKCFDLRKSLKLSLSFIFAIAFMMYLEDINKTPATKVVTYLNNCYNENSYEGTYYQENGRCFFVYSWQKPPE